MAIDIYATQYKCLILTATTTWDVTDRIVDVSFRMVGNADTVLDVKMVLGTWAEDIAIGDRILVEIWYSNAPEQAFRTGFTWIYEIASDNYFLEFRSTCYNFLRSEVPGDAADELTILTNKTLRDLVDYAARNLQIWATGVTTTANTLYIGTSEERNTNTVVATSDRPYLEMLYYWARRFGFFAYCWRNALYCIDFREDISQNAPAFEHRFSLESRVTKRDIADVRGYIKSYYLPNNQRAKYKIPWSRTGRYIDLSSENYYFNSYAASRRRMGAALSDVGDAQTFYLSRQGRIDDQFRPGKVLYLGNGFFEENKGRYIIYEVTHTLNASSGFKTTVRGVKEYSF